MPNAYCGNNCEQCAAFQSNLCPGCLLRSDFSCSPAACCREKGLVACADCPDHPKCTKLRGHEAHARREAATYQAQYNRIHNLAFLSEDFARDLKWLFWIQLIPYLINILPIHQIASVVISILSEVMLIVVLFAMGKNDYNYQTAAKCKIALCAAFIFLLLPNTPQFLIFLCIFIFDLYIHYKIIQGHAAVLLKINGQWSEAWLRLWKWILVSSLSIVPIALHVRESMLFLVLLIGIGIALLICFIVELVYLMRFSILIKRERPNAVYTVNKEKHDASKLKE